MKKKKLSKTALKKQSRDINKVLRAKVESKYLDEERLKEDIKDKLEKQENIDVKKFNEESINNALRESGVNVESNVFADMERIVNSNEPIKELVDIKNIRMKTNVTEEQHHIITILFGSYDTLVSRYGIKFRGLERILNEFMEIAPSVNGLRSEQFVDAHKAIAQAVANANHNPNAIRQENEMKQ